MYIYLIERPDECDYDEFDSAVVCCATEEEARMTHPRVSYTDRPWDGLRTQFDSWVDAKDVVVTKIGLAHPKTERGVICASFNAG